MRFGVAFLGMAMMAACAARADNSGVLVYPASYFADQKPNTAYDMITRLPAFVFDDGTTARGFAGTAGNVLVDSSRPTSKTDDLESILQRIPASNVDRIEVIRGGAPGVDMHGQTVVANVIRKTAASDTVVVQADDNIFKDGHQAPDASIDYTRNTGTSTYEGSIGISSNYDDAAGHGIHQVLDPNGNVLVNQDALERNATIGAQAHGAADVPLMGGRLKANITLETNPNHDSLTYRSPDLTQIFRDNDQQQNVEMGLTWNGQIGNVQLETLALQRLQHETDISTALQPGDDQIFTSIADTGESIMRSTVRWLPIPALTLEAAAEGAFNYLDGKSDFIDNGAGIPLPSADAYVSERRGEASLQGTWKARPDLMLELGARFEYSTIDEIGTNPMSRSFFYPKPRAVVTWNVNPGLQARLSYEKIVGQLNFNDFTASSNLSSTGVTTGNANIRPNQTGQTSFTLEQHFWGKGALSVTLTHEDLTDVIDYVPIVTPTSVFDAPGNIGSGHDNQVDVELTLPLDRLGLTNGQLKSTTIFRHFVVHDPETGLPRGISGENDKPFRPQDIELTLSQDIPKWNSTWSVYYFNGFDEDAFRLTQIQRRDLPPFYLNAFWEYKPTPSWSLHFEVDNITGFRFHRWEYNYAGPRATFPLQSVDYLLLQSQPRLFIQIRKTFG